MIDFIYLASKPENRLFHETNEKWHCSKTKDTLLEKYLISIMERLVSQTDNYLWFKVKG